MEGGTSNAKNTMNFGPIQVSTKSCLSFDIFDKGGLIVYTAPTIVGSKKVLLLRQGDFYTVSGTLLLQKVLLIIFCCKFVLLEFLIGYKALKRAIIELKYVP